MVPAGYCVNFGRSIGFNVTSGRFLDRKFGGIWDPFQSGWKFLKFITSSVQRCLCMACRYLSKPIRHLLSYPTFRQFNRQTYKHKKTFSYIELPTVAFEVLSTVSQPGLYETASDVRTGAGFWTFLLHISKRCVCISLSDFSIAASAPY